MENKMFRNLIKITQSLTQLNSEEVIRESDSMSFIKIKAVDQKNLPKFLIDLKSFIGKLDDVEVGLYRSGAGP